MKWRRVSMVSGPTYFSDDGHWTILIIKSDEHRLCRERQPVAEFPTLRLGRRLISEPATRAAGPGLDHRPEYRGFRAFTAVTARIASDNPQGDWPEGAAASGTRRRAAVRGYTRTARPTASVTYLRPGLWLASSYGGFGGYTGVMLTGMLAAQAAMKSQHSHPSVITTSM